MLTLTHVTITGADDQVDPATLLTLSRRYPFVEWGILVSRSNTGAPRFPSETWQNKLLAMCQSVPWFRLSVHLCGEWARDLLAGGTQWLEDSGWRLLKRAQRIQLNGNTSLDQVDPGFRRRLTRDLASHQVILQDAGYPRERIIDLRAAGFDVVPLFDHSGGRGLIPNQWPLPLPDILCGYAGGLGPETLPIELPRLGSTVGSAPIWIDMERRVRTDDNRLDLAKVTRCLEIAAPYFIRAQRTLIQRG